MAHGHSRYSGSGIFRVPLCPGSARLAEHAPPQPESEYAREGTRMHELLHERLTTPSSAFTWPPDATLGMIDAVREVTDYVDALRAAYPDLVVLSEQHIFFPQNVVPAEMASGTADILCFSEAGRRAWCIDFKGGVGQTVEADDNWQIQFYATAAFWDIKDIDIVTLVIIQPRSFVGDGGIREWNTNLFQLAEFQAEVEDAIRAAEKADAPLIPGERQCHWCPAGIICNAREEHALRLVTENPVAVQEFDKRLLPEPKTLDMARVGYILTNAKFLQSWLGDVAKFAEGVARGGGMVPGFKLVETRASRSWNTSVNVPQVIAAKLCEITLGRLTLDEVYPRELIGITKAEELVTKAAKELAEAIDDPKRDAVAEAETKLAFLMTKESSGNLVLVPDTDKRPAVKAGTSADFAGVVPLPLLPQSA